MSGRDRSGDETEQVSFGRTALPDEQARALRRAEQLEWVSLPVVAATIAIIMAVMGSSQAMKAAWIEDLLSFLPPIAFLISNRVARRRPHDDHPWGHHRAVGIGHLAAAMALLVLGGFVVQDAAMTLVLAEHPTVGTIHLFGHTFWQGWLMMGGLVVTAIPTMILGHLKMKAAQPLHDKILHADADMMRADWMTAAGGVLGLTLLGFGLWWADSAVAILIGADIVKDGVVNIRNAVRGLSDAVARTYDDAHPHPLVGAVRQAARDLPGVAEVSVRMRDMGHVFHTEVFVVPALSLDPTALDDLRQHLSDLDWKLGDLVVIPVPEPVTWD